MIYGLIILTLFILMTIFLASKLKFYKSLTIEQKHLIRNLELKLEFTQKQIAESEVRANFDFTTKVVSGFFSNQVEITYLCHLIKGGIPIGSPTVMKVDQVKIYDKEQVQKALYDFAGPFLKSGIKVGLLGL